MTESADQRVRCTMREDGVAEVRLARPEKLNALDPTMFEQLVRIGQQLSADPNVRAVVLCGDGRAFCAGLDVEEFERMVRTGTIEPADTGDTTDAGTARAPVGPARSLGQQAAWVWAMVPVPVIVALHGAAFGGGLQIALGADIRLATPDARISVMEINWGIVPDMTGTQLLPELVGRDVAKELTYTGRELSGTRAAELGLATRVEDTPVAAAHELAAEIATKNPDAVRHAKRLLNMAGHADLTTGFAAEQHAIHGLVGSPNQVEAVRANFDKRAAEFASAEPDSTTS